MFMSEASVVYVYELVFIPTVKPTHYNLPKTCLKFYIDLIQAVIFTKFISKYINFARNVCYNDAGNVRINVTLRRVRKTIFAVEKQ